MQLQQQFIALLNQHQGIVHKVCNLYMDSVTDREDLFQEITYQAFKAFKNFKGKAKFSTWLYRVALNTAITFYRKEKRQPEVLMYDLLPEAQTEANDPIEEQLQAMYKAIGKLSNTDKAIIMLYLEDYSYNEISEVVGITANNVAVKMNRIKSKLKEQTHKIFENA
ncbi:MAG: RNA polymerase sigma factor [Chitinophagaceae bacterium]|nr:RNA polymerase sigma factor [Chitinophagaceae bacterium]